MRHVLAALLVSLWVMLVTGKPNEATAREVADLPRDARATGLVEPLPVCPWKLPELRERAVLGDAQAQVRLGDLHKRGCGANHVRRDRTKAEQFYQKAAVQGHLEGQHKLGLLLYGNKDYEGAIQWFRRAASRHYQDAIARLHAMYTLRHGVPEDNVQAVEWFREASGRGDVVALTHLGIMYHSGYGIPRDYKRAYAFYHQAANMGDPRAQLKLGTMYYEGVGTQRNLVRAKMWYDVATMLPSQYREIGRKQAEEVARLMTETQISEARGLTRAWMKSWGATGPRP